MKKHKIPKSIKVALAEGKQRRKNYKIFNILRNENLNDPWWPAAGYKVKLVMDSAGYYAPYIPMQSIGRALRTSTRTVNTINIT